MTSLKQPVIEVLTPTLTPDGDGRPSTSCSIGQHVNRFFRPHPAADGGRLRTLGLLGRGGQAVVYKARHHGQRLAGLEMRALPTPTDAETLSWFRREAEALAGLTPNIVQIYEVGDGRTPFFAMEYVRRQPARLTARPQLSRRRRADRNFGACRPRRPPG